MSPRADEWLGALAKLLLGVVLMEIATQLIDRHRLLAGWFGMAGIVFILHFGSFHVLSLLWRQAGVDARPLMDAPVLASSLSDFWGNRWNLAFRELAHRYLFQPTVGRLGVAGATMAVFIVSGAIHDLVISVPARANIGLPTLYFVIQGVGVLLERTRVGRRLGLRHGATGRLFCAAVLILPVGLLFHPPFVRRVVVPLIELMGRFGS